ncbi:MAG: hypothetical protein DI569_12615 [Sphingopyxis macrogoltabida]|uniref:Uncharacterized protein n=1 Tax=Sphingopyxis macrogoltabida TaxID=33050 RepID=A0A2W5L3G2_SPHMC|nr:MAG: hypothetical protein DI569_12615 [Sphingopyxis macrogoltabida]
MSDTTTEATAAFAFMTAILKELDARHAGFADAVFERVEADIILHEAIPAYADHLAEGLSWARAEVIKARATG